jgi:hypothetical protein
VAGWERSGESVRGYSRSRGLSEASFYFWKRELKRRDVERVAVVASTGGAGTGKAHRALSQDGERHRAVNDANRGVGFAEVRLAPSAVHEAFALAALGAGIEIACAGSRRIGVHPGFDEETLLRVLAALERAARSGGA